MIHPLLEHVLQDDVDLLERLGIEVVDHGPEQVVVRGRPHLALTNSHDVVHGSHAFALMDTAAAYALAARGVHAATIGSHLTLSRPVIVGAEILATARVITAGRTLASAKAELTVDGRPAAFGTFQFAVVGAGQRGSHRGV